MTSAARNWTGADTVQGVRDTIRELQKRHPQHRTHLRKELARKCDWSLSFADKIVNGQLTSIAAHHLLTLGEYFGPEFLDVLTGRPETEEQRRLLREQIAEIEKVIDRWS